MKTFIFILLSAGLLLSCRTDSERRATSTDGLVKPEADFLIIPGKRVGIITATSTETMIRQAYTDAKVRRSEVYVSESSQRAGTVVFPDTKDALEIVWEIGAPEGKPAFVRIGEEGGKWKTPEGVAIGMSLEALEEANGKPFRLYGFEWDYGGLVVDWNGGRLNSPYLIVALMPQNYSNLKPQLLRDVILRSDDEAVRALQPKIASIVLTFE